MNNWGNVYRYLKYLEQSSYFYFYILIFCFVVFGVFGILPLSINIFKKLDTIKNMQTTISNLDKKLLDAKVFESQYKESLPYLPYLNMYMPTDINVDDYLTSLNAVVVNHGFSIRRLSPKGDYVNNSQELLINIEGYGVLPELIKNIESLKRITKINTIEIQKVKGKERINLGIQIFSRSL